MTTTETGITAQLASFVVETTYESLPPELVTAVKRAWVDTIGVTLAGAREDAGEIAVEYAEGKLIEVEQHDGSVLRLRKLDAGYDPRDRIAAMNTIQQRHALGEVVTGLLYVDPAAGDLHSHLDTVAAPLNSLGPAELNPGAATLDKINQALR